MKTIKLKFLKGLAGYGYGYMAGQVAEVAEKQAIDFLDKSWAQVDASNTKKGEDKPEAKVKTEQVKAPIATDELPESLPMRELLLENDLDTIAKVKAHKDLAQLKGIGEKSKQNILKELS